VTDRDELFVAGLSDPFVVVTMKSISKQTEVIKKTLTPEWKQVLHFPVINDDGGEEVATSF